MTAARFVLPADRPRDDVLGRMLRFCHQLDAGKAWEWTCAPYKRRRSTQQNAYLWGVCYATILREGGEALRGWSSDDLHEYFLGEHFGWETLEGFGRKRLRPLKRSSKLSTAEFAAFVDFIQRKAAELGIYVPVANEGQL
jgi:hypothetical protein